MTQTVTTEELLERIEAMHAQLAATVAALTPEQLSQPTLPDGWAVKDVLAHITWWEQRMIQVLESLRQGVPFPKLAQPGEDLNAAVDRVNAETFAAQRNTPAADVLMQRQRSFAAVLAAVAALADGDTIDPAPLNAVLGGDVLDFVAGDTYEHYAEHDTAIKEWLGRTGVARDRSA